MLGQGHGLFRGKPKLTRGLLLEAAGDKRRHRIALPLLALNGPDHEGFLLDVLDDSLRIGGDRNDRLLPVDRMEFGFERRRRLALEQRGDRPIFDRSKGFALRLPLADHLDRNGLHTSHAQASANFFPQQLAALIADDPVQHPARLLRVH